LLAPSVAVRAAPRDQRPAQTWQASSAPEWLAVSTLSINAWLFSPKQTSSVISEHLRASIGLDSENFSAKNITTNVCLAKTCV
jgi:hypothetical protein